MNALLGAVPECRRLSQGGCYSFSVTRTDVKGASRIFEWVQPNLQYPIQLYPRFLCLPLGWWKVAFERAFWPFRLRAAGAIRQNPPVPSGSAEGFFFFVLTAESAAVATLMD